MLPPESVSHFVWCCTYFPPAHHFFFFFVQTKRAEGVLKAGADKAVFRDIAAEADTLEVRDSKAIMVLVELLFDENCIKQVGENDIYLEIFFYFLILKFYFIFFSIYFEFFFILTIFHSLHFLLF